jgi:hypothetical protein
MLELITSVEDPENSTSNPQPCLNQTSAPMHNGRGQVETESSFREPRSGPTMPSPPSPKPGCLRISPSLGPVHDSLKSGGQSEVESATSISPPRDPRRFDQHTSESRGSDFMQTVSIDAAVSPSKDSRDRILLAGGAATNMEADGKPKGWEVGKRCGAPSDVRPVLQPKSPQTVNPVSLGDGEFPLPPKGINESAYIHSTDTSHISSHLLASKSNYQCIIEGKTSELGLSYPDQLLTNLITKRTYHSVAERGRRNRMNKALQEMAKLLPRDSCTDGANDNNATNSRAVGINSSGSVSGRAGDQMNSKASTVEMAIEYIKSLQKGLMEMKSALEERRPQQIPRE